MLFVFEASSIKRAFFWHFFFWIILFTFKPANGNFVFLELTRFKSLFLVNFQVSTLNESHHILVKLSCKSAWDNLDAISARSEVRSYRGLHYDCVFSIYTLLMYTSTRLIEAEQHICSKTPTPEVSLQNLGACRRWSCPILERLVDLRNDNVNARVP